MNKKSNLHIEVVRSSVKDLSSMSQASCDGIVAVLSKFYKRVGVTTVNTLADLEVLVALQPDLVFMGMKYVPQTPALGIADPHKIWVSDFLDQHGIAYTGSNGLAHELELDKGLAKQRVLDCGLQTSQFFVVKQGKPHNQTNLRYPLFVKPIDRGGGLGIDDLSVVNNATELESKLHSLAVNHQADAIVESYLSGREFSVAILKDEFAYEFAALPIELIAPVNEHGARLLSDAVKSADSEKVLKIADEAVKAEVTKLALQVFHALGAQDYGRIDIRLDGNGTPQFLEANLIPSLLNHYGNFPKSCLLNSGIDFETVLLTIVRLGLQRTTVAIAEALAFNISLGSSKTIPQPL